MTGVLTDPICQSCGRPVIGAAVYGAAGPYHAECVRGPNYTPQHINPHWINPTVVEMLEIILRLDRLEKAFAEHGILNP